MAYEKETLHKRRVTREPKNVPLGGILKAERERREWSRAQLREMLSAKPSVAAIGQWEMGFQPHIDNLRELCALYGINLEAALAGRAEPVATDSNHRQLPAREFTIGDEPVPNLRQLPQDVEVRGVGVGGADGDFYFNGDVIQVVRRPPGLSQARNLYAVFVASDSMEPRFFANDLVYVNPDRVPAINDFVVIELHPDEGDRNGPAYIKQLVRRSGTMITVRQFNPPQELQFETARVKLIHRIVPWNEVFGV